MSEVKWIKITTDIFDDEKILLIESMPDAYAIITVWFKLLCLAGKQNNGGVFTMSNRIAYTNSMLATIFRMKETTVNMALQTFEQFGMVEIIDGVITIPNWEKHQNIAGMDRIREQTRKRVEKHRENAKFLSVGNVTSNATVTHGNATDIELEGDIEVERDVEVEYKYIDNKEKEIKKKKKNPPEIENLLNNSELPEEIKTAVNSWLEYKLGRGETYKPQGFKGFLTSINRRVEAYGTDVVIATIEESMGYGYMGICWEKSKEISRLQTISQKKKGYNPNSFNYQSANFLKKSVEIVVPDLLIDEFTIQSWAKEFDELQNMDGRDPDEITDVLKFAVENKFWKTAIVNAQSFRKNYVKLLAELTAFERGER